MDEEEDKDQNPGTKRCSHTHSCNPTRPENASHCHTCFHTHTHLIIPHQNQQDNDHSDSNNKKRPFSNREAVMKYREKKRARTAYLEDEMDAVYQQVICFVKQQEWSVRKAKHFMMLFTPLFLIHHHSHIKLLQASGVNINGFV